MAAVELKEIHTAYIMAAFLRAGEARYGPALSRVERFDLLLFCCFARRDVTPGPNDLQWFPVDSEDQTLFVSAQSLPSRCSCTSQPASSSAIGTSGHAIVERTAVLTGVILAGALTTVFISSSQLVALALTNTHFSLLACVECTVRAETGHLFEKGAYTIEYRFLKKDGAYCWVNDTQQLIRDENGQVVEVVGSWSDITQRKQLDEALTAAQEASLKAIREAQTRLTDAIETISEGFSLYDAEDKLIGDRWARHSATLANNFERLSATHASKPPCEGDRGL